MPVLLAFRKLLPSDWEWVQRTREVVTEFDSLCKMVWRCQRLRVVSLDVAASAIELCEHIERQAPERHEQYCSFRREEEKGCLAPLVLGVCGILGKTGQDSSRCLVCRLERSE